MADPWREGLVGLEHEAHVRADLLHVLHVEKQVDGEPLVDEHIAKGWAEDVEGDQTGFFVFLT